MGLSLDLEHYLADFAAETGNGPSCEDDVVWAFLLCLARKEVVQKIVSWGDLPKHFLDACAGMINHRF